MDSQKLPDEEMAKFLDGVIGVVEATSYEHLCIWQEEHQHRTWKQNNAGFWQIVGHLADMPVCIGMHTSEVDGHKLLFVDSTSQVVDHRLIDAWLNEHLPSSAYRSGGEHINRVDAMNFHNIFPRTPPAVSDEQVEAFDVALRDYYRSADPETASDREAIRAALSAAGRVRT